MLIGPGWQMCLGAKQNRDTSNRLETSKLESENSVGFFIWEMYTL